MSSVNPVVILPGALAERGAKIAEEFADSCLAACGQMCTSPGLTILFAGNQAEDYIAAVKAKLESATPGVLLSAGVARSLQASVNTLRAAGAELVPAVRRWKGTGMPARCCARAARNFWPNRKNCRRRRLATPRWSLS